MEKTQLNTPNEREMKLIKGYLNKRVSNEYGTFPAADAFAVAELIQRSRLDVDQLLDRLTPREVGWFLDDVESRAKDGEFLPVYYKVAENIQQKLRARVLRVAAKIIEEDAMIRRDDPDEPNSYHYR